MPSGITITNVPEAADPTALADWAVFITSLTGLMVAVGWPIVVVVTLLAYRQPISRFIDRVKTGKGFGVEVVTETEKLADITDAVEDEAAVVDAAAVVQATLGEVKDAVATEVAVTEINTEAHVEPAEPREPGAIVEPEPLAPNAVGHGADQDCGTEWTEFEQAKINAWLYSALDGDVQSAEARRKAVVESWGNISFLLRLLLKRNGYAESINPARATRLLREKGIISPTLATLIMSIYNYRTEALVGRRDFPPALVRQIRKSSRTARQEITDSLLQPRKSIDSPQPPS